MNIIGGNKMPASVTLFTAFCITILMKSTLNGLNKSNSDINIFIPVHCDIYNQKDASKTTISSQEFKVGLLVAPEVDLTLPSVFNWTIDRLNRRFWNGTKLVGFMETFVEGDLYSCQQALCKLLDKGVTSIVGPADGYSSNHIASICHKLNVIHFNIQAPEYDFSFKESSLLGDQFNRVSSSLILHKYSSIDLSISRRLLYEAYLDLIVNTLRWEKLIYMYDNDDHLFHFEESILRRSQSGADKLKFIIVKSNQQLQNPHKLFRKLRGHRMTLILLDIECNQILDLLKKAQQVNMMTEANAYVILCPDLQHLNLEDFQFSDAIILWMNPLELQNRDANLMRKQALLWGEEKLIPEKLTVKDANVHDSLFCIAKILNSREKENLRPLEEDRSSFEEPNNICQPELQFKRFNENMDLTNHILEYANFSGYTGRVEFNSVRERASVKLNILRQTELGPRIIGNWTLQRHSIELEESEMVLLSSRAGKSLFEVKEKLKVVSITVEPFFMLKRHHAFEHGNDRFEGFVVDLMAEIAHSVGFEYELIEVSKEHGYGIYDVESNDWDGPIGEIVKGRADLALGGLSVTSAREEVVDFTYPFMRTGIGILFKKPTQKELSFFSFFEPFKANVWLFVIAAYVSISTILFIVGHLSPREWTQCELCERQNNPNNLINEFNLANSFWFIISALMQQGCDLAPKSLPTRIIASFWYFFTLIIVSIYTANLASFLSIETTIYPFESAQDLYENNLKIRYGCFEWGSTRQFFARSHNNSLYRRMLDSMEFVQSISEGKARVEAGNFAFFTEAAIIDYAIERNCNFTQIGGQLDAKGYAIALSKNSTRSGKYRSKISEAILGLLEKQKLQALWDRWWRDKGGQICEIKGKQQRDSFKEFSLANLGGVFAIVLIGIWIGFVICAIEIYCNRQAEAKRRNTTKWLQMKRRICSALEMDGA